MPNRTPEYTSDRMFEYMSDRILGKCESVCPNICLELPWSVRVHCACEQDGDSQPRKPDGVEVAIKVMQANDEEELRGRRLEFDILSTLLGDANV